MTFCGNGIDLATDWDDTNSHEKMITVPDVQSSIEIIIKLVPLAADPESPEHRAVRTCAASIGLSIQPMHSPTSDPELATYFVARVDRAALSGVVEHLLACEGVEGAYAKPGGEPPA